MPLAWLADVSPVDAAERLRDLHGLALLESARPGLRGRWSYLTADPIAVLEDVAGGPDPFASARGLLARLDPGPVMLARATLNLGPVMLDPGLAALDPATLDGDGPAPMTPPPFLGGLVGFIGYDVGRDLAGLRPSVSDDQDLPPLRLALHDWVIAWDRREGRAWLGGRAVDSDVERLRRRLADVLARLGQGRARAHETEALPGGRFDFRSPLDRSAFAARVEAIRAAIAAGEIYQANLTRRLETPFRGDPWALYRRLRSGEPSPYAAYLDLGIHPRDGTPRAVLSASPEPFIALSADGVLRTDPIKGTRPRGRTRAEDRALTADLLASDKDRAENTMIVDVLRNDLGRVSRPGSVTVPRLCRLERTASVQHLVSTVRGRLAPGIDAFDVLAATLPGGSITGAPKIRAMEVLERLEPVRRGPYTGAVGWIGPDGAMATSIAIRTFVADGHRLTLHVGGGITWRSRPAEEWDETVAKAAGPLRAIGGSEADAGQPAMRRRAGHATPSSLSGVIGRPMSRRPSSIAAAGSRRPGPARCGSVGDAPPSRRA